VTEIREDLIGYDAAARERILELEAEQADAWRMATFQLKRAEAAEARAQAAESVLRFIVVNQTGVSPVAIARAYLRGGDAEQTSP